MQLGVKPIRSLRGEFQELASAEGGCRLEILGSDRVRPPRDVAASSSLPHKLTVFVHDTSACECEYGETGHRNSLVYRIVHPAVQVVLRQLLSLLRVENHDVGVAPHLYRSLPREESELSRGVVGRQLDEALQRDQTTAHAVVENRQYDLGTRDAVGYP